MDRAAIAAIIEQYVRHGWKLRRVLMTSEMAQATAGSSEFGDAEIRPSGHGGLWFSRRSHPEHEAWELRRVSASPFAVVEVVPEGLTDQERDELLEQAESRMFESTRRTETSH